MRVLMVHNDYARPSGEEESVDRIALLLRSHGHEVAWYRKTSAQLPNSRRAQALATLSCFTNKQAQRDLTRLVADFKPDIAHIQNLYPLIAPSSLTTLRHSGVPVVMRCPNYRLFCPNGLFLSHGELCTRCQGGHEYWCMLRNCEGNPLKSALYAARNAYARISRAYTANVDMYLVLSAFQKSIFHNGGIPADQLCVLPNFLSSPPAQLPYGTTKSTVAFVGRVSTEKGPEIFLQAARALPQLTFEVAGDGPLLASLRQQSPPNVVLHGHLDKPSLSAMWDRTRLLAITSTCYDSFPNVALQAMARGIPVIASDLGALPEIVQMTGSGRLFPAGNAAALASLISDLWSDHGLTQTLGAKGQEAASLQFSPEACYKALMHAYSAATARHSSAR